MRGFLWLWALIVIKDENIAQLQMIYIDVFSAVCAIKNHKSVCFWFIIVLQIAIP